LLRSWQNFYMIAGSAAATLTGLMFVATTLVPGLQRRRATMDAGMAAYHTPTMIHFCAVLLMAGILSAPWPAYAAARLALGAVNLALIAYLLIVARRMRRMPQYQVPGHDWLWYVILPLAAYAVVVAFTLLVPADPAVALYLVGAAMLAVLLIGIRNAWDLVTFMALVLTPPAGEDSKQPAKPQTAAPDARASLADSESAHEPVVKPGA
jgi:hypothetical protein